MKDLPNIVIKDGAVSALSHGAPLARPGVVSASKGVKKGSSVLISSLKGEAVAIGEISTDSDKIEEMKSGQIATASNVIEARAHIPRHGPKNKIELFRLMLFVYPLIRFQSYFQYHHSNTHHRPSHQGSPARCSDFRILLGLTIALIETIIGQTCVIHHGNPTISSFRIPSLSILDPTGKLLLIQK